MSCAVSFARASAFSSVPVSHFFFFFSFFLLPACCCVCRYLTKPVSRAALKDALPLALQQEEAGPSIEETTEGEPDRAKTGRPTAQEQSQASKEEERTQHTQQRHERPDQTTLQPQQAEQPSERVQAQYERQPQLNDPQ